jgi:flavin-dependent dehydrogenase
MITRQHPEILVIGGGPGGLACATLLAQHGARVTLVERKAVIGPKVCAGGITWNGLIRQIPPDLIERAFTEQHLVTPGQSVLISQKTPIIATVNRQRLGQWMAQQAEAAGVTLLPATRVLRLAPNQAFLEQADGQRVELGWKHLVGADGANSLVRRFLRLPSKALGIGLHCMTPGTQPRMEWHLNPRIFGSGYGWIFPHGESYSVGAYGDQHNLPAQVLKERLITWAAGQGIQLDPQKIRAGLVNYDYRGLRFDRNLGQKLGQIWLVGDAAGLASGLTGEGIYPALLSGQVVARSILESRAPDNAMPQLKQLIRKHQHHRQMVQWATHHPRLRRTLMETMALLLRLKLINFSKLEMAD